MDITTTTTTQSGMKITDRLSRLESFMYAQHNNNTGASMVSSSSSPQTGTGGTSIVSSHTGVVGHTGASSHEQNIDATIKKNKSTDYCESIYTISNDISPSLFLLLTSSSNLSHSEKEQSLLKSYITYIDSFIATHILESLETIYMDYRLIALTLEFISAAQKDICSMSGIVRLDLELATTISVWLLHYLKRERNSLYLEMPNNIEILIKTMYDIVSKKYIFEKLLSSKDVVEDIVQKKKKYTFIAKAKLRLATIKNRASKKKRQQQQQQQ